MLKRILLFCLLPLALAGCAASPPADPAGSTDHPANPNASEAPLPPPSQVLAAAPSAEVQPSTDESMPGMQHAGHNMGGMSGMGHAMPGMAHPTPASRPAATQPGTMQPAALYMCVMHSEVVSDKPGKCPKCGMELVRKSGATPSNHGGHE